MTWLYTLHKVEQKFINIDIELKKKTWKIWNITMISLNYSSWDMFFMKKLSNIHSNLVCKILVNNKIKILLVVSFLSFFFLTLFWSVKYSLMELRVWNLARLYVITLHLHTKFQISTLLFCQNIPVNIFLC